ncbi:MAG: VWA domain-containing protein, partial [Lamprocystis purpurea]|nr:VWA domain-containing protein [Lamprocystis purpurea]
MFTDLSRTPFAAALAVSLLGLAPGAASAAEVENRCTPTPNQVVVRFTYGSEKAPWIHEVTDAFNRQGEQT